MKKGLIITGVIAILLLVFGGSLAHSYNGLVSIDEDVKSSFSQVDNVIQRRADLIPNLVETVQGYASHESETFANIAEARSQVNNASGPEELAEADAQLTRSLRQLSVVVEDYPELKANESFIRLQDELAGTENRIAVERKNYNDTVNIYNSKIRSFPTNIMAGKFNFEEAEYFEADEASQEVPEVSFGE